MNSQSWSLGVVRLASMLALTAGRTAVTAKAQANVTARTLGDAVVRAELSPGRIVLEQGKVGAGRGGVGKAALALDGGIVFTVSDAGRHAMAAVDAAGRVRWRTGPRSVYVESLGLAGDTVVAIELDEGRDFVLLDRHSGNELSRFPLPHETLLPVRIVGRVKGEWAIEIRRMRDDARPDAPLAYQTFALHGLEVRTGTWRVLSERVDSAPRFAHPSGRVTFALPFGPRPQFVASESHGFLYVSGTRWLIEFATGHTAQPAIALSRLDSGLSHDAWRRAAVAWAANPPVVIPGVGAAFFDSVSQLDPLARGRTISHVTAADDGTILLRRRDADSLDDDRPRATTWDLVDPHSHVIARFSLAAGEDVLSYAGAGRLLTVRKQSDGGRRYFLREIKRPESPRDERRGIK